MPKPFTPRPYQTLIRDHILDVERCAVWADMGMGKTSSTLDAIHALQLTTDKPVLVLLHGYNNSRSVGRSRLVQYMSLLVAGGSKDLTVAVLWPGDGWAKALRAAAETTLKGRGAPRPSRHQHEPHPSQKQPLLSAGANQVLKGHLVVL